MSKSTKNNFKSSIFNSSIYPNRNDLVSSITDECTVLVGSRKHKNSYLNAMIDKVKKTKSKTKVFEKFFRGQKYESPKLTLFEIASSIPTTSNTRYIDRAIKNKLCCKGLETIYASTFLELVKEVREEFVKITHDAGLICVIKPPGDSFEGHREVHPFKHLGKTPFYHSYLKIIERFESRLLITFPLIRKILKFCVRDLTDCLFSLRVYREATYDISELYAIFDEEILKAKDMIRKWYGRVVEYVRKDKTKFSERIAYKVYSCGTSLMATFLTLSVRNTIEHVIEVTENEEKIPLISMKLRYEKKIVLRPSTAQLCHLYIQLIGKLVTIANNLRALESYRCNGCTDRLIPIFLPLDLQRYYEKRVKYNIVILFGDVNLYVKELNAEFSYVFAERQKWIKDFEKRKATVKHTEKLKLLRDTGTELYGTEKTYCEKEEHQLIYPMTFDISELLRVDKNTGAQQLGQTSKSLSFKSLSKSLQVLTSTNAIRSAELLQYLNQLDIDEEDSTPAKHDISFEEGYEAIKMYRSYMDKLSTLIDVEHYQIGQLIQFSCRDAIQYALQDMMDKVSGKLISQHIWLNEDICEQFEMIKLRALTIPKTSEELIEIGTYMARATTEQMNELLEKIYLSVSVLINLVEMTSLTKDHMRLNSKTIAWGENIKSILEENTTIVESCKTEFDDRLQHSITELNVEVENFLPSLNVLNFMDDISNSRAYIQKLSPFIAKVKEFDTLLDWINKEEVVFKYPLSQASELKEVKSHLYRFHRLVKVCFLVVRNTETWLYGPFEYLDYAKSKETVDELYEELITTQKMYKNSIRQAATDGLRLQFTGVLDDPDPLLHPAPLKLCAKGIRMIEDFKPALNMMNIMCNDAMLQRHWDEMSEIAGFDLTPDAGTTLDKLMNMGLLNEIDKYDVISTSAIKERALLRNLLNMQSEWNNFFFKTGQYNDTEIEILTELDDIRSMVDDHIVKTLAMRGSVFVKPYAHEVQDWYDKIKRIAAVIDECEKFQNQWLYLSPIFSSEDIVNQMKEEGVLFREVDKTFRGYLEAIIHEPRVTDAAFRYRFLENLVECSAVLEKVKEGIAIYLEGKRLYFPRFFFLSNGEVLEILSQTKNPLLVQPYLRKCFDGIHRLMFDDELKIHAMQSQEGELIRFSELIDAGAARDSVEKWLTQVESAMLTAIRNQLFLSKSSYREMPLLKWITQWPSQVIIVVFQIFWTADVHFALKYYKRDILVNVIDRIKINLEDLVSLIRNRELTNLEEITIKALIIVNVQAKDVTRELFDKNAKSENEFTWLSQLKYYWEDHCEVKIINAVVKYANEYLGKVNRLIVTPLTTRCRVSLMGAYNLHLNGSLEGPTATGKTETIKDLAQSFAVKCINFNCSSGMSYKTTEKYFKGVVSLGAWLCFDDFNRIDVEVLSVVAQQLLCITQTLRTYFETFVFAGTELRLNPTCYICITTNPGYTGRSELPDNLRILFRTVAMTVPDYTIVGQVFLYSCGFEDAKSLSLKIVTMYRLCAEKLSPQNYCDYGMRAVVSLLMVCADNKKKFPLENESITFLRSVMTTNLSKLSNNDVPLFEGIMSDLFPGVVLPTVADNMLLVVEINITCQKRNLQVAYSTITKMMETYNMLIARHGFMLVGEQFVGKTTILRILADALTSLHQNGEAQLPVRYQFINPKSITLDQLYGYFDPVSLEWFDGVVATYFRMFAVDAYLERKWIIFDGPVDAIWIENLNTVLDDNKKLCLLSGEIITMTAAMSVIFEVTDLSQTSPSTVRCGMVYMDRSVLGWKLVVRSWLPKFSPDWTKGFEEYILAIFDWVIPASLYYIRNFCQQLCYAGETNLVKSMITIMDMIFTEASTESSKKDEDSKYLRTWLQATFMIGMTWGLGSILDSHSREKFDVFLKNLWRGEDEKSPCPSTVDRLEVHIPETGLLFDYFYIFRAKGLWKSWFDIAKTAKVHSAPNTRVLIPTVDSIRYVHMIEMHIKNMKPLLLIGPTGTGKSFYLQDLLMNKLHKKIYEPAFVTFTVNISANQTQDLIISKLQKLKRGYYGPPRGKSSVIFVDDLNVPFKEIYGAQPTIELLRQYFDHKNWYDLKDKSSIYLNDILIIGAMSPPGGNRQEVSSRFLRHFSIFSINNFSDDTMYKIYSNVLLLDWKNNGFPSDVVNTVHQVVNATLDIYKSATGNLLPTPSKSHYVFNLRDFSRIICGCAMLRKESTENKITFPRIWVHEVLRVIYDRLVNVTDRTWFFDRVKSSITSFFKDSFEQIFEHLQDEDRKVTEESLQSLMFGTYLEPDRTKNKLKYEEVTNTEVFLNIANKCLDEYNSIHKIKIELVLFKYALEHLSKICRILSMPRSSGLLIGVSGSGRQSLTKLATVINGHSFFQPKVTKNYTTADWREDLKRIVKEAGGLGRHTVFLFTEGQMKKDFLQDIDGLLNSGEVPNIFLIDEKQEVMELVRLAAQGGNRNLELSQLAIFEFFVKRTHERLHIILCFSPIGTTFRIMLRQYPSLVNCCTVNWFDDWPEAALEEVAHNWMVDVNLNNEMKNSVITACKYFHVHARKVSEAFFLETARKTYVTTGSYLELIKLFSEKTNLRQSEIINSKRRYELGLDKLQFTDEQISQMQKDIEAYQPELELMSQEASKMMAQIEKETEQVERATASVKKDQEVANAQAAEAQTLKADCESELALAIPILEEAIDALNTLKPTDITLVKSMKNPPEPIKLVMAAVCVIKDVKPDRLPDPSTGRKILDYWGPSKRILGDMNFLQSLKDFDKDHIKNEIMAKIRKDFLPHKDFKPHIVTKASSAAEGLCKWIIAMDMYDKVAKEVAPKKAKLEEAERAYAATMVILLEKKHQVSKLEKTLANLHALLFDATAKKNKLQNRVDLCGSKLLRANKLMSELGGEKSRWIETVRDLRDQHHNVAGDILLSCGVISYLPSFTMQRRSQTIKDWFTFVREINIPITPNYDFTAILGNELKMQEWRITGLSRDAFSMENAIIQENSKRRSLLVDPQARANLWIKNMEQRNGLKVTNFFDDYYIEIVQSCVEAGKPVLIENIGENLESSLDPILFNLTFEREGVTVIAFNDTIVSYHKNFKLYLTSKIQNPHFSPDLFNNVTVINFTITLSGFEDRLLEIVVAKEKPDLHRKYKERILNSAHNKASLANLEEAVLITLSESKEDILEDEKAIEILHRSKTKAADIIKDQAAGVESEEEFEIFRTKYNPVATYSAVLYYCVADLSNINPMYQYSLAWFINLYVSSIDAIGKFGALSRRILYLQENFTYNLYVNVCRSLFEKDKLIFSFLLCIKILSYKNEINDEDYDFFLSDGLELEELAPNPASVWLNAKSWNEICRLNRISAFRGLKDSFEIDVFDWKNYFHLEQPQNSQLPVPWCDSLSSFQKLLVIKTLRLDKLVVSISKHISEQIGKKFIESPPFDIRKSYETSTCLSPLIFILSSGIDPLPILQTFSKTENLRNKFHCISLGEGQECVAKSLIKKGQEQGFWICLQNCHLAEQWMTCLEELFESMDLNNTHMQFRLWLTTYPSRKFPISVLQNGVKMTNETPSGLQRNLLKSYTNEPINNEAFYSGCPRKYLMFTRLLYGVAYFHAVIQGRRSFGYLGWNFPYDFNESDFNISIQQLQIFINEYMDPYEGIRYLIGECNYGGKISDDWDRRLIVTLLEDCLNQSVARNLDYSFSVGDCYRIPRKSEYDYFIDHIASLTQFHPAEVYGLHNNAGITKDLHISNQFINILVLTRGKRSIDGDEDNLLCSTTNDILTKLPANFELGVAKERYPFNFEKSTNTVLIQEMEAYNKLLSEIRSSLRCLQNVTKGIDVITSSLESIRSSLQLGQVPIAWMKISYPSLKTLPSYIEDLLERITFIDNWYKNGTLSNFWLSGFFFPRAFLAGTKQDYARKYAIPIDQVTFDIQVMQLYSTNHSPEDGVYLCGIFIDGARWDMENCVLAELYPKVIYDRLPLTWLMPILLRNFDEGGRFTCPLYETSERRGTLSVIGQSTNYILSFLLNTNESSSHWVKRGVALLCQRN
ncbi:hypothetical protein FQA39_LY01170 [Lamprigera yunnana]|nr:hypothetical protein FQA39_LY01170 [Lamprigera yunnana]